MCGIFGFAVKKPINVNEVFEVLKKLESHRYLEELRLVGGYGAGVAILNEDGSVLLEKIGKTDDSPVKRLSEILDVKKASVLVAHVRMPSVEFMKTANFKETAQPYITECDPRLTIVSVHNGRVTNYKQIKEKLGTKHMFESEKVELIDSEVIPHYFEELLEEQAEDKDAVYALSCGLEGSNTIGLIQIDEENTLMHLVHKGKTRGLTIWTNGKNEVIFCSRKEPVMDAFARVLIRDNFSEKISIAYQEEQSLSMSFSLDTII